MNISILCQSIDPCDITGPVAGDISGLYFDSRRVSPGGVFFALRGASVDGHRFIAAAVERGAIAVVMEDPQPLPAGVTGLQVRDARRAMALASAAFYGEPTRHMLVVGITGTNGKTTISYLLEALLKKAGYRPAVMGTVDYRFEDQRLPSSHTTPESVDLMATIAEFRRMGADALVMEVSSHALEQRRVDGVFFDVGVFTNLTPEHLDYHGDLENYFSAKLRLFTGLGERCPRQAVVNLDDPWGARLAGMLPAVVGCGLTPSCAVGAEQVSISLHGISAIMRTPAGMARLRSPLIGNYNVQNLLCAAGVGVALNVPPGPIAEALGAAPQVPGRLESVPNRIGALVLVDYAHTGDALENVLTTLRQLGPRRLLCVFGCGGDRDAGKRPVMGEVAGRLADLAILTSDNPRSEEPLSIITQVEEGLRRVHAGPWSLKQVQEAVGRGYLTLCDRREAIGFAVSVLQPGDVLLVAGKGHEDYQIIGTQRLHFDDREELRKALASVEGKCVST
ncbi:MULTISPECIES: UDP-N-acetylmuramoyl-L-alanyl-D-glutamate--2,6-diaminopimelate ligase [Syntrophotalea]|uniref:UDP-N-acetylmuramoyl-L-alanyl-D-glutamate--2,6-diaminopimelate ligase n=1 Tax=Syntrophotalea acetylenica TaxID=29542 RepID=A0A1L3GHF0_SYNAC|nr:UDP-N-acetylmuramoyl-L-alanyl-D-glutamate--2,6-diaminopimelate ligase [Syntrophotalea acetylenica]APG25357.1 UDP-N-acetylmuramoyl-L-alanyl-D-glutamate--2,6-diaminopimelate ligase [Syntrophotalea acetylenica]APG43425.1 UDP-N-acetylmuramoyl-L-alanyl-D-glutamate--2,6-diaminopimelate ligase [Syntrophotalea acetylenica]